jgi:choline-sulfatase
VPVHVPLLATVLQDSGYVTAALYGNNVLKPKSGLGRGFASYETFVDRTRLSSDGDGVDRALAWIASAPRQPWFLWVHLMSPHGPYNSSPRSKVAEAAPDPLPDVELQRSSSNYGLGAMIPKYQLMQVPPRAAQYRARYRDEVLFVDAQVGRLLDTLDPTQAESTVVVFTADHGESLGENDYFFQHGWLPNEPSLHVPMIWSQPGRIASGHRVAATTSLVDVMPTLLAGLGLASPPVDGRDLSTGLVGGELADATSFAVTAYANQVTAAMRGPWKLVHTPPPPHPLPRDHWHDVYPKEESWALHDLRSDPRETTDLSGRKPRILESLRRELHDWETRNDLPSGSRASEETDA